LRKKNQAMKIGYARVSTEDQKLDLQIKALKKEGCTKIYREKASGSDLKRPEFEKMLDSVRSDDTIVVWRLDRLARSTRKLLETTDWLIENDIKFKSLSESWADTTSAGGKLIMTVFSGIAEFEKELIKERTSAGRKAAIDRGVKFGRPRALNSNQLKAAQELRKQGYSIREIAENFGVHQATIYRNGIL